MSWNGMGETRPVDIPGVMPGVCDRAGGSNGETTRRRARAPVPGAEPTGNRGLVPNRAAASLG